MIIKSLEQAPAIQQTHLLSNRSTFPGSTTATTLHSQRQWTTQQLGTTYSTLSCHNSDTWHQVYPEIDMLVPHI